MHSQPCTLLGLQNCCPKNALHKCEHLGCSVVNKSSSDRVKSSKKKKVIYPRKAEIFVISTM